MTEVDVDRNGVDWEGPFTAMITPFHPNGEIDESGLRDHVEFLVAHGVRGLVPNGCTGEFWAQTIPERKRVAEIVLDAAKRRVPVLPGVGASATRDVIELAEHSRKIGCDGVMIMAPFMVHPKKEDLFQHFKAVSDRVPIPIMLYNNPQDVGNDLSFDLVERLCDLEWVVAIKDSTFDYNVFWKTQCALGDRIRVFIGPSTMFGARAGPTAGSIPIRIFGRNSPSSCIRPRVRATSRVLGVCRRPGRSCAAFCCIPSGTCTAPSRRR